MNFQKIKSTTIFLPIAFLIAVGTLQHYVIEPLVPSPFSYLVVLAILAVGVLVFSQKVFNILTKMSNDVLRRNRELSTLNTVASIVGASLDVNDVMSAALDKVLELMSMDVGEICLWDDVDAGRLVCVVHRGLFADEFMEISKFKLGEDFPGRVAESGKTLITYDLVHDERYLRQLVKRRGFRVLVCVPLKSRGKIMGTMDIASRSPQRLAPRDVELLESVGSQIGMALENIQLYSEARKQSEKLRFLNEAGLSLTSELSVETVLQKVVDLSRGLVQARYAALSIFSDEGKVEVFFTSGLDPAKLPHIGAPPEGLGLLGILPQRRMPLRLRDITKDPHSAGFPPHHPPMNSFLGVPIILKGKSIGNLYLTDKEEAVEFSLEDEQVVSMLAAQAAIAIENARLYQEVESLAVLQERDRIAREMHDGLAQALGYLNLKIDHVESLVSSGNNHQAKLELDMMRDVVQDAYSDVRESIVGLRASIDVDSGLVSSLENYLDQFSEQSGIAVELSASGIDLSSLNLSSQIQLIRIIQEALTNVRKHARASRARVRFDVDEGVAKITIEDDGCGFDPATIARPGRQHFGLHIMRERAESLGGNFSVDSSPGRSTTVTVTLPTGQERNSQHENNKTASSG